MTQKKNMSQNHALGLLANMIRESSLKTTNRPTNGEDSDGMFQWHKGRLARAKAALGSNWNDPRAQIDYALIEQGEPGQEYLATDFVSPEAAADWWMSKWERPYDEAAGSTYMKQIINDWLNGN